MSDVTQWLAAIDVGNPNAAERGTQQKPTTPFKGVVGM